MSTWVEFDSSFVLLYYDRISDNQRRSHISILLCGDRPFTSSIPCDRASILMAFPHNFK
ncbi:hypothetical protein [Gloeocapsopsis sp. IPPAS B-1203]|uniref:hypothetical protein n=1 Tax=Gloeocapsopsis sp. IPPAS B-1203 TaxID=2049454 RepID=UPI0025A10212|nr:hypothetical protein [Gloeocapsopsis sp. IPPAS B-1203]